ncbi:MAG: hypothetical protein JWO67_2073, partial [Streptosporangiaceae bacterium]|nr:hypothetical protein [Streptosporangiaceae bacterium]
ALTAGSTLTPESALTLPVQELITAAHVESIETVGAIETPALATIEVGPHFYGAAEEHRDGRRWILLPDGLDDTERETHLRWIIRLIARAQGQPWFQPTFGDAQVAQ